MSISARVGLDSTERAVKAPRGRLRRYSLFQLKDFVVARGLPMLIIALAIAYPQVHNLGGNRFRTWGNLAAHDMVPEIVSMMMWLVFVIGGLLTVPLMGSRDRAEGYHRFLFAKPVSITRYYAHQFVAQLVGFVGVSALIMIGFNVLAFSFPITGVLAAAAVFFIGLGGLGFLFSTLVRGDWLWLLGTMVATGALTEWAFATHAFWRPLLVLLPPIEKLVVIAKLMLGQPVDMGDVAAVLAYGLATFGAGMLVLKKRSITA
jgi:hypothetical protein